MVATRRFVLAALAALAAVLAPGANAQEKYITVASTTSTEQSGLFGFILPIFEKSTGIQVRVVALGTGQALDLARRGDADVVFVHDPAGVKGNDIVAALTRLAAGNQPFVSRGDKSGTHAAELRYWKTAGIDIAKAKPAGYKECGCGMGPALNMGSSTGAYVLTDRGTWLSFKNRADLGISVEGDTRLFNQYGVMLVNPAKHPHVKKDFGQKFADWVVSPDGQRAIAQYTIGGQQLFFPNAKP